MLDHIAQHKKDEYIKVYQIRRGEKAGLLRPEHHVTEVKTGRGYGGTDTKLSCVIIPDSVEQEEGKVWCRYCGTHGWLMSDLVSNQKPASTVRFIREHEGRCKKKKCKKLRI